MNLAIMQPYFMPHFGYFQLINLVDKFIIYDDVNYINKGWINRNKILINAKPTTFTIPLRRASQNKLINEIELLPEEKWKKKLLKSIEFSYKKSANFNAVFPFVCEIITFPQTNISEYNLNAIKIVCNYLKIFTEIIPSSSCYLNQNLKGQSRILDICLREKATMYTNPIGGIEIYTPKEFSKNNLKINFLKPDKLEYSQFTDEFIPFLSIIDMLMFLSVTEIRSLLNKFTLL